MRKSWAPTYVNQAIGLPEDTWTFLEGRMGDVMQYSMTGMHPNPEGGLSITISFVPTVKFKVGEVEIGVSTFGAGVTHRWANNDRLFGSWFVNYCDPSLINPRTNFPGEFAGSRFNGGGSDYHVFIREGATFN